MKQSADPAAARGSLRPTLYLTALLLLIAAGMFAYTSVLTSVGYDVEVDPGHLFAIEGESACLRVHGVNRLGGMVPFSNPVSRVEVIEGVALLRLEAAKDSSSWTLVANGEPGTVTMRVYISDWPFPLLAVLHIESPTAQRFILTRSIS
jgi:hypothetical protein